MHKVLAILAFVFLPSSMLLAQDATEKVSSAALPQIVKPSRDFLMLQFNYNTWLTKPDSIKSKSFGYSFNGFLCYDFPIKKSHLSFATGIGVSTNVIYLDKQVIAASDTGLYGAQAHFIADTNDYKRYKFNTTYLQAPFELRYFSNNQNRNKGFKAAIGLQVGTLLGAHTKGVRAVEGTNVKDKVDTKRYLNTWNFVATARIGYGNLSLFGSYNLTQVYKDNAGPAITPMAIGICLTGL